MLLRNMANRRFHFTIDLSAAEYLKYYSGRASRVNTTTHEGYVIEFPANNLKPWVSRSGVKGTFMIEYDDNNRLQQIQRLKWTEQQGNKNLRLTRRLCEFKQQVTSN